MLKNTKTPEWNAGISKRKTTNVARAGGIACKITNKSERNASEPKQLTNAARGAGCFSKKKQTILMKR